MASPAKVLNLGTINSGVKRAQYAVRGELAVLAESIRQDLQDPIRKNKWPFDAVINCNIGNPQQLGQKPISFLRQVCALVECPHLLDRAETATLFPGDAIARTRRLLDSIGSVGAYSHSQGIPLIREHVSQFIAARDGHACHLDSVFLTDGASTGVKTILQMIIQNPQVGVMIPIPQYPLYSAAIELLNGISVPYFMDESNQWGLNMEDLKKHLAEARGRGVDVRALCIINPGNPTGNILSIGNMREIVKLCHQERLVLVADEVYQTNVYNPAERPWFSFRKVAKDMGSEVEGIELFSLHSISKGMIGECGRRGGYFQCTGIDADVIQQFYKLASISLCPNISGQVALDVMVNPPTHGDASFRQYTEEISAIYDSLKRRAVMLRDAFSQMEGVSCNLAQGAMYLFAKVTFSRRFLEYAREHGKPPDLLYAIDMLKSTGVCVVPGSGFGQEPSTFHFRSTFLPPESTFLTFCQRVQAFHGEFMRNWR